MSKKSVGRKKNGAGRISFLCIGVFLVLVLSVQMVRLYQKNEALIQEEQSKQEELQQQQQRQEELSEQEQNILLYGSYTPDGERIDKKLEGVATALYIIEQNNGELNEKSTY